MMPQFFVLAFVNLLLSSRCWLCSALRDEHTQRVADSGKVNTVCKPTEMIYVLGDSHGDLHFFVHQLLSTKRFMLLGTTVMWATRTNGMCCCTSHVSRIDCQGQHAYFTNITLGNGSFYNLCCNTPNSTQFQNQCDWSSTFSEEAQNALTGLGQVNVCPFEEGETESDDFEVVIAGDAIDRGSKSREILDLIRMLQKHEQHGSKLIFLLGNHEEYLLRYAWEQSDQWARAYDWAFKNYKALFNAGNGTADYMLLGWLRSQDVIYKNGRTLVMHGGLQPKYVDSIKKELTATGTRTDADKIVEKINQEAHQKFKGIWECVQKATSETNKRCCGCGFHYCEMPNCANRVPVPLVVDDGGVVWEREFSSAVSYQINKNQNQEKETCNKVKSVGEKLAVNFIVLGHTTHPTIKTFCKRDTLVFAVDTTNKLCQKGFFVKKEVGDECDFQEERDFLHAKAQNTQWTNSYLPSSLRIAKDRWVAKCAYDYTRQLVCEKVIAMSK